MKTSDFWNKTYVSGAPDVVPKGDSFRVELISAATQSALEFFGDVAGKSVLDVGCGPGESSLAFAARGANVTAFDVSRVAIERLDELCRTRGITNVRGAVCSAMEIESLGTFDFIFGNMILHHLEPFGQFAASLAATLKPGGRAFFSENSAANPILMWARKNLVGRAWIPKNSDDEEFPLTPQEVELLRKHFRVEVRHPQLVLFEMFDSYVLRNRVAPVRKMLIGVDNYLHRFEPVRRLSYVQDIYLEKAN